MLKMLFEDYLSPLDKTKTFENVAFSKANKEAVDAAESYINQSNESRYYPLMIVGNSGCGKTHLSNAIANQFLETNPSAKIAIFQVEEFKILMTEVERQHLYSEFDTWLSSHDLIIFEDVHKFQEYPLLAKQIFWHINSLLHAHKKLIFTSICPPDKIKNIEDRLRSRLNWNQILKLS